MIFGVTGQHQLLTPDERWYVQKVIKRNVLRNKRNKLVSGCAFGVDTEAVIAVWGLLPFENLILTIPGTAPHNWGLAEQAAELGAIIIKCDTLHTVGKTYLARDDETIAQLTPHGRLLAFPRAPTPYRSGTWATINRAKKAGVRIRMYPLDPTHRS